MSRPTLSVLTPNYNHAQYISQAIEAVVSQSRLPDEYLILDDGSTDSSVVIIEQYAAKYPFIRLYKNEKNIGVVAGIEKLLALANGDYIYVGAADDYILPGFFEKAMNMVEQYPQAGIVFGNMVAVDKNNNKIQTVKVRKWNTARFVNPREIIDEMLTIEAANFSLSGATILKRDCLADVGWYHSELGAWLDTFAILTIELKFGACYVPEEFMAWRILPNSFSNTAVKDVKKMLDIGIKAARLMRSEFKDRFPEKYVKNWIKRYKNLYLNLLYTKSLRKKPLIAIFEHLKTLRTRILLEMYMKRSLSKAR
jgi:glycosyltransferase involved in cell wall biosynthesis